MPQPVETVIWLHVIASLVSKTKQMITTDFQLKGLINHWWNEPVYILITSEFLKSKQKWSVEYLVYL